MGVNGIYGLSGSGLDIESMVKVGMMSKQNEYDKMKQTYTKNEWTKEAFVNLYGKLQTFNNSTLSNYKMSSTMNAREATSANESVVTVTANANAGNMTHYVEVDKLSSNAYLISNTGEDDKISRYGTDQTSSNLKDVLYDSLKTSDYTETENGKTINFVEYTDSEGNTQRVRSDATAFEFAISDGSKAAGVKVGNSDVAVVTAASSVDSNTHTVNILSMATTASLTTDSIPRNGSDASSTSLSDIAFTNITDNGDGTHSFKNYGVVTSTQVTTISDVDLASTNALSFTIGDGNSTANISFTYDEILNGGATLEDLATKINDAGLNITASYDEDTDSFTFGVKNNEIGSAGKITVKTVDNDGSNNVGTNTSTFITKLGLKDASGNSFSVTRNVENSVQGTDAVGTFDGETVSFSGNEATVNGFNVTAAGVGSTTVSVDQKKISVTFDELVDNYTFNDLTAAINTAGTNVRASYDSVHDSFTFYNTEGGKANNVTFSMSTGDVGEVTANFFNALNLKQSSNGELESSTIGTFVAGDSLGKAGTNAEVKIDGVSYSLDTNKTSINGVTYTFKDTTTKTDSEGNVTSTNKVAVNVTQDVDKIVENVKSFVEDYNNLIKDLYKLYDEEPNKNYKPLTDSQKDAMKDEQIEKWEEKAKAGLLYHDKTLRKIIDNMRDSISQTIDGTGKYNSAYAIGISTTGIKGQLTLDEDKLRAALAEDSESVYNVFAKLDDDDNASGNGIAQRLGDVLNEGNKAIKSKSGTDTSLNDDSDLSTLLRELNTKMSNFRALMNAFEDKLYKKYDAMEVALSSLGTQLNYVTSAFA